MQVVILTAGKGTRMKNLTKDTQKTMIGIKNKPKLVYTLENLPKEITEVVFIVKYLKEQIINYFKDEYNGLKIHYIEQKKLDGTGGAVLLAKDIVEENKFLVLSGDDLYQKEDLKKMIKYNYAILTFQTESAERFGLVEEDKNGFASSIVEKPHNKKRGLINTGAYVLSKEYFNYLPIYWCKKETGLPQTLASMYPKYKAKVIKTKKWQPIGSPEELKEAKKVINKFFKE